MTFVKNLFYTIVNFTVVALAGIIIGIPVWGIIIIGALAVIPRLGSLILLGVNSYAIYLSIGMEKTKIIWIFYGGLVIQAIQVVLASIIEKREKERQEQYEKMMVSQHFSDIIADFKSKNSQK